MSDVQIRTAATTGLCSRLLLQAGTVGSSVCTLLIMALRNRRTRRQLAALESHHFADIGLSQEDVMREVRKSFPFHSHVDRCAENCWR